MTRWRGGSEECRARLLHSMHYYTSVCVGGVRRTTVHDLGCPCRPPRHHQQVTLFILVHKGHRHLNQQDSHISTRPPSGGPRYNRCSLCARTIPYMDAVVWGYGEVFGTNCGREGCAQGPPKMCEFTSHFQRARFHLQ